MENVSPEPWQSWVVTVDPDVCEGYGVCVGIDAAIFELDECEDTVLIRAEPTSAEQFKRVESAVQHCPKRALRLEERQRATRMRF